MEEVEEADTVGQKEEVRVKTGEGEEEREVERVPLRLEEGEGENVAKGEAVVEVHLVGVVTALPCITTEKVAWYLELKLSPK